ncbi:hypothetical protein C484_18222 [Natrialba taiwanensis DSM 12281]|uniref:Uncharacterized protein n=1 Tax=Natrialba taiwanensis DSM 12281 TaxID=1230458 RepID=L9ZLP3_9EURY|nr:hypothetical protein C484_18222 [Natrialba taiwanensis DSM 12281]
MAFFSPNLERTIRSLHLHIVQEGVTADRYFAVIAATPPVQLHRNHVE